MEKNMDYKLIFCDVDGTLIDKDHNLSDANKNAIKKATDAGIQFVLCSGRTPVSLVDIAGNIGVASPYVVGFNGGTIWNTKTNQTLQSQALPTAVAKDLLQEVEAFSHVQNAVGYKSEYLRPGEGHVVAPICFGVYVSPDHIILQSNGPQTGTVIDDKVKITRSTSDIAKLVNNDVLKIIMFGSREQLDDILYTMEPKLKGRADMYYTNTHLLEFVPKGTNKGQGITWLANHLGVTLGQTIAIGDNYNDIEMIKTAGLGIATANAVAPLKEVADHITTADHNNNAVTEAIEYILNK